MSEVKPYQLRLTIMNSKGEETYDNLEFSLLAFEPGQARARVEAFFEELHESGNAGGSVKVRLVGE